MIGQIQISNVTNVEGQTRILQQHSESLISDANAIIPNLIERGGGVRKIGYRRLNMMKKVKRLKPWLSFTLSWIVLMLWVPI